MISQSLVNIQERRMGLPVQQIMAEVELMLAEPEDAEDVEGQSGMEMDEEDEGEVEVEDFGAVLVEAVQGDKEGSTWLIVEGIHILHWQQETKLDILWRCQDYRWFKCPFKMTTTKLDDENGLKVLNMTHPDVHICSKDKVRPIIHKFKLRSCQRMREDQDIVFRKTKIPHEHVDMDPEKVYHHRTEN